MCNWSGRVDNKMCWAGKSRRYEAGQLSAMVSDQGQAGVLSAVVAGQGQAEMGSQHCDVVLDL